MPSDSFTHALERLDPASRALLDLSLRRGMRPEEIAEVLGAEPDSVAASRDEALEHVAQAVGMTADEQRDEVRARLAELPAEEWLGGAVRRNGHSAEPAEPEAEVRDEEAGAPVVEEAPAAAPTSSRRGLIVALLLGLLVVVAIVVIAIASGSGSDAKSTRSPAAAPVRHKPAASKPAKPKPKPAKPKPAGVAVAVMGRSHARGSVRLASGGKRLVLRVRGLRAPRSASYQVWLYDSVLDARRIAKSRRVPLVVNKRLPAKWRRYRFVDVSFEPADGNPNHSGRSVARVPTTRLK